MSTEIISHAAMCVKEGISLQRGMNFGLGGNHSVLLMSVRPGSPYKDRFEEGGSVLIYEGHDENKKAKIHPKRIDQPERTPQGKLTQNGLFLRAATECKSGKRTPERVRVYEKIKPGIWSYNGVFHLVDGWKEHDGRRTVFRFKLVAVEGDEDFSAPPVPDERRRRIVPTAVKLEVWKRDGGKCVMCGATDELQFDHDLPYSKGGTSIRAKNVQLLCARHNLSKHDQIL